MRLRIDVQKVAGHTHLGRERDTLDTQETHAEQRKSRYARAHMPPCADSSSSCVPPHACPLPPSRAHCGAAHASMLRTARGGSCSTLTVHVSQVSKCEMRIFSSPPKTAVMKSISKSNLRSSPCWGPAWRRRPPPPPPCPPKKVSKMSPNGEKSPKSEKPAPPPPAPAPLTPASPNLPGQRQRHHTLPVPRPLRARAAAPATARAPRKRATAAHLSYMDFFWGSDRTSYACWIF